MENNNTKAEIITQVGDNPPVTWPMNSFTPWFARSIMSKLVSDYHPSSVSLYDAFSSAVANDINAHNSLHVLESFNTSRNSLNYTSTQYGSEGNNYFYTTFNGKVDALGCQYSDTTLNGRILTITKTFKNIDTDPLNILETHLNMNAIVYTAGSYHATSRIIARDDVDITIQPSEYFTITYNLEFGNHITNNMVIWMLMSLKDRSKLTTTPLLKNVLGNNVTNGVSFFGVNKIKHSYLSKEYGLMIGSDNSDLTGNEYCLRSEIPWESTQKSGNKIELSGTTLRFTRLFKNVTNDPITIGEVAFYSVMSPGTPLDYNVQNDANNRLWMSFIQPLTTPIILQPGENVELTMKIVIP